MWPRHVECQVQNDLPTFCICFSLSLLLSGVINWPAGAVAKVKVVAEAGLALQTGLYRENGNEVGLGSGTRHETAQS